ncbi:aquaporin family protein [Geodermatophilus sp. YIM 151500]|uniref:MIP/aquaporin family protein n=1 Tax=Geodermatophilus sp. YIM 151500 TaxID=2984531 RepID=UPI0021E45AFA|nr:MIP/aquaporin family protein [Geodermatophilus sp. YIM 151500]MCV2489528.1 aquaporin family protein [Geodermatophilus sp. YIM 151500]
MIEMLRRRPLAGELLVEFAGTMILILFGLGVVAQVVAGQTGDYNTIAFGWGFAVALGVYTAARGSGAHLNPAVTLALAAFRGFSWGKVLPYVSVQVAAAFLAALIVRWNYNEAIAAVDPGTTSASQGIFSTLPAEGLTPFDGLRDQIIGTALLVFLVFVLIDARNNPPLANMAPLIIGFVVLAIGLSFGSNAGYAINPARDFGPRLASWLTGYETAWVTPDGAPYWWVPIVGPLIGGLLGAAIYELLVGNPLSAHPEEQEVGRVVSDPEAHGKHVSADSDAAQDADHISPAERTGREQNR